MDRAIWGWVIKGTQGAVNMLDMLARDNVPISEHFMDELEKLLAKLASVVVRAKGNVQ